MSWTVRRLDASLHLCDKCIVGRTKTRLEIGDLGWRDGVTRLSRRLRRELAIPTDSATDKEVMRQAGILLKVRDFLVEREREPGSYLMVGTASDDEGESEFAVEFVREGDVAWCELVSRARIRNESKIRSQADTLLSLGWFDPQGWGYVRSWLRGAQLSRWYRTVGLEGGEVNLEDLNRAILETFLKVHDSPPVGVASAESEEPRRPPGPAPEFYSPR